MEGADLITQLKVHEPVCRQVPRKPFLTTGEFAGLLGISLRTFRRWKRAGFLPRPTRPCGWARWSTDEIVRWLHCGQPKQLEWEKLNNTERNTNG
jgi:hypothetical protein